MRLAGVLRWANVIRFGPCSDVEFVKKFMVRRYATVRGGGIKAENIWQPKPHVLKV